MAATILELLNSDRDQLLSQLEEAGTVDRAPAVLEKEMERLLYRTRTRSGR